MAFSGSETHIHQRITIVPASCPDTWMAQPRSVKPQTDDKCLLISARVQMGLLCNPQPIHLIYLDLVPEHIFESANVITDLIWSAHGVLLNWCWVRRPQFLGFLPLPGWFLTTGLCRVPVFYQILCDICFDLIYKYWWRFRICNVQSSGDWPRLKASNWKKKKLVTGGFCQSTELSLLQM